VGEAETGDDLCRECAESIPDVRIENVREFFPGLEREVPLFDGGRARYVNLDNAATTPPFTPVVDCLGRFFQWYSSVHRGTGFKSLLSTHAYERCRQVIADFIGADLSHHTLIFVQNATHALNKLAMRLCLPRGRLVLATMMEHHSNLLPWRKLPCPTSYVAVNPADGTLDMGDLERQVRRNSGELCLITVSGASNVTGNMPPIRRIARLAHEHGAMIAVDATQLLPRRPFRMGAPDDPERIDFAAFSAHKMYAPFGCGVLVGPRRFFEEGPPDVVGGGTIQAVTLRDTVWAEPPEREEAGTPNVLGAIALATAARVLESIGMEEVAAHERQLTRLALRRLAKLDGLTLYGRRDPELREDRVGIIPLAAPGLGHAQLAAALGYEWGIGVRNGCFCAQPYVRILLGVGEREMRQIVRKLAAGDHASVPGMVRMSLGVYNTAEEVELFADALERLLADGPRAQYVLDEAHLDYVPAACRLRLSEFSPL
jgi:selenocysteine lyase/cysteine desulfurase